MNSQLFMYNGEKKLVQARKRNHDNSRREVKGDLIPCTRVHLVNKGKNYKG